MCKYYLHKTKSMENIFTSMFDFRVKKFGIITAVTMLVLDLGSYLFPRFSLNYYDHHILFHYLILLSLIMIVTSKDRIDDELAQRLRYTAFKVCLTFSSVLAGIAALILSVFDIDKIGTLTVLYYFEGTLLIYLLFYYLGYRYAPKWMLSEITAPERLNRLAIRYMIILMVCVALILVFTMVAILTGEV